MSNKNKNAVKAILRTAAQLLAVMAIILVTFTSCGKNDDGDNKKLIGTWVWESATLDGRNVEDIYRNLGLNIGTCYKKTKLVFTDKEVALYFYFYNSETDQCEEEFASGSYVLSGNTLVGKGEGGAGSLNISIVGNKLIFNNIFEADRVEALKPFNGKKHIVIYRKQ